MTRLENEKFKKFCQERGFKGDLEMQDYDIFMWLTCPKILQDLLSEVSRLAELLIGTQVPLKDYEWEL